ncbi:iporin [Gouania willdenowi]|uniref:iporin n=1 Tax=Gouania willdenowi TaxID=441366 RepID=UPI0010566992|nr:iporin-like [Gouania willdenowi]
MIEASRLSGNTLIACHFPVVQLPTWQLPVQALCSSAKRTQCSAGLTRAVSLPEQDLLNKEHAFTGGRRNFSCSYGSLTEDRVEEEGASDSTSSPEETSSHLNSETSDEKVCQRLQNSFLPNTALDEDDEDEDFDGDNLHRYREDSSFVLHGNLNWSPRDGASGYTVPYRDVDCEWNNEGTMLSTDSDGHWNQLPQTNHAPITRSDITMTTCFVQDSGRLEDKLTCCMHNQNRCSPGALFNSQTEYVSDSSSNSSDGILVNFCTIYDKSNNPATPLDLRSPSVYPSHSSEGSVFLNLQPIAPSLSDNFPIEDPAGCSSLRDKGDIKLASNSKDQLYSLERLPSDVSSLEVSDLTACLQNHDTLATGTNPKYYKLVDCDLSSQSPSPAWSSAASCPEGQNRGNQSEEEQHSDVTKVKEDVHKDRRLSSTQCSSDCSQTTDYQVASTSCDKAPCRTKQTNGIQNIYSMPCSLWPGRSQCQDARAGSTQPSVVQDGECSRAEVSEKQKPDGVCPQRYSKAQRPTSLPIQPFVLVPSGKAQTQAQHLGGLLEQYMNQKSNNTESSQPGSKFREKSSHCVSNAQLLSMKSYYSIILEAPSSSDTCSTCTPSPECFSRRYTWSQPSQNHTSKNSPDPHPTSLIKPSMTLLQDDASKVQSESLLNLLPAPKRSTLVKIPTYQDLINLTPLLKNTPPEDQTPIRPMNSYHSVSPETPPTLPLTTVTLHPNLSQQHPPACAADSSIFHSSFTAALSSMAALSSLGSVFSSSFSGLQKQESAGLSVKTSQSHHCESLTLSDRPTETRRSADTFYDSMSISDLQRRGLLRSVSRAVDLIMAHFGSSRDPEVKMRLGKSSCSPTIAGLVLEHLCPAIQILLEDGLRDHNLDFIIGQRRNHSWNVVEISTRTGPSTRVLQSLVFKIKQCSQLSSPCMRLRAFIMGLLNLRALEFWLSHLHSQKDVVTTYYHSWGFLSVSLSLCRPLFDELLLLLQPLNVLPFDLNLLLEPRLLRDRQLCSNQEAVCPLQPCSGLLATSWPKLQADRKLAANSSHLKSFNSTDEQQRVVIQTSRKSPVLAPIPEWWPKDTDVEDSVFERGDCSRNNGNNWFQISMGSSRADKDCSTTNMTESPCQHGLRWAKLFGAGNTLTRAETTPKSLTEAHSRRNMRPSQWLHLDKSQLGLLAKSVRSLGTRAAATDKHMLTNDEHTH